MTRLFQADRILVPTDFSAASADSLAYAVSLAKAHEGRILFLHVAPDVPMIVSPLPEATIHQAQYFTETLRKRREAAQERMEAEIEPYQGDVEFEIHFEEGDAAATIARVAADQAADLVVMGSHGRTGIKRALLGSVAERAVRISSVPVLIVHQEARGGRAG